MCENPCFCAKLSRGRRCFCSMRLRTHTHAEVRTQSCPRPPCILARDKTSSHGGRGRARGRRRVNYQQTVSQARRQCDRERRERLGEVAFRKERADARADQRERKRLKAAEQSTQAGWAGAAPIPTAFAMPLPAACAAPVSDVAGQLERVAELKAKGVLTDAEFTAAKAKILAPQRSSRSSRSSSRSSRLSSSSSRSSGNSCGVRRPRHRRHHGGVRI